MIQGNCSIWRMRLRVGRGIRQGVVASHFFLCGQRQGIPLTWLCGSVEASLPASMPPAKYLHPCRQKKPAKRRDKKEVGIGQIRQHQLLLVLPGIIPASYWQTKGIGNNPGSADPPRSGALCQWCIDYARPAGDCQQQ